MSKVKKLISSVLEWCRQLANQPLYPLLFAWYFILFFYAHNIKSASLDALPVLLAACTLGVVVVFALSKQILRDWHRAALATSVGVLLFFLYAWVLSWFGGDWFDAFGVQIESRRIVYLIYIVIAASLGGWLWFYKRDVSPSTRFINLIGIILILFTLFTIVPTEIGRAASQQKSVLVDVQEKPLSLGSELQLEYKPDIYYLVFDRYAGGRTQKEFYGIDPEPFWQELEQRDFYVAKKSHTNYPRTIFSLSSTTNLNYLQKLVDMDDPAKSEATTLTWLLSNNIAGQKLKELGYTYYHIGNWWGQTQKMDIAENILPSQSDFAHQETFSARLLYTTMYPILAKKLDPEATPFDPKAQHRNWANFQYSKFIESPFLPNKPKFVFGHILMPHEPFVFDNECMPRAVAVDQYTAEVGDYVGQLECANKMILEVVDSIQKNSDRAPIIIVQSDEGPVDYSHRELPDHTTFKDASIGAILERNRILNAYFFPDQDYSQLYQAISPVNSFRTLFRQYFGLDLPNLEDRLYVFSESSDRFNFIDVTARVKTAEELYETENIEK